MTSANLRELFLHNNQRLTGPIPLALCSPDVDLDISGTGLEDCLTEPEVLHIFYEATNGDGWFNNEGWLTEPDVNDWYGITAESGTIIQIDLSGNLLSGAIPSELGQLSNLEILDLSDNEFSGGIPSELGDLSNLRELFLHNNQLSGAIPSELGDLTNLRELFLHNNQRLTGPIPLALCSPDVYLDISGTGLEDCLTEPEVLHIFYEATNGDGWFNNEGWLTEPDVNDWYGITAESGTIIQIDLSGNLLSGAIPSELGQLSNLEILDLSDNEFSGGIPSELGDLSNLRELFLHNNQLSGAIPSELGDLINLRELVLSGNLLSGAIPSELGDLTNLSELDLFNNQLSGEIPSELGQLSNLEILDLSDNEFSGGIPSELGDLTNLRELFLHNNQRLTGPIPLALCSPDVDLDISGTGLEDCLTEPEVLHIFYEATNGDGWFNNEGWLTEPDVNDWYGITAESGTIIQIDLSGNLLSGAIPPELSLLFNLEELDLSENQLSGEIPSELGNLHDFRLLWVNNNQRLTGPIPLALCSPDVDLDISGTGLEDCSTESEVLHIFYEATNGDGWFNNEGWFTEPDFNDWHGIIAENGTIIQIDLYNNQLSGEIPSELGDLINLRDLVLSRNLLSGAIPSELGDLTNLIRLDLFSNQLSGEIPSELGQLSNLITLKLYDNQLSGEIPSELGQLSNLIRLDLDFNQLSGEIPSELGNLSNLTRLWLNDNQLSGEIPSELGNLSNLTRLWLNDNQLSGEIPSELGNLSNLTRLWLNDNQLSGAIPSELGQLSNLEILDLSDNEFSGGIPSELGDLTNLRELFLHNNQRLTGPIPLALCSPDVYLDISGTGLEGCVILDSSGNAGGADGSLPSGPALTATVRVSPLTGGVVTSGVPGINCGDGHTDCELSLAWGETLTLMADASAGYEFAGWVGACTGTDTCTISAAVSAVSVEAVFDQLPTMSSASSSSAGDAEGNDEESLPSRPALTATVRVSPLTGGVVTSGMSGINCGDGHTDCELSLAWGETLTLMADASAGYEFAGWVGACTGTDTCTISAAVSAVSVEAVFDQLPTMSSASSSSAGDAEGNDEESLPSGPALTATVRVSPLTGGVVTSGMSGINCGDGHTDCELSLAWGETLTLMADASAGYEFAGWVGACTGTDTCTISAAVSAVSVEAVFDQLPTMSSDSSSSAGDAEGNDEEKFAFWSRAYGYCKGVSVDGRGCYFRGARYKLRRWTYRL